MRTSLAILLFIMSSLTVADFYVSHQAISSGRYQEANPLTRWYVEKPYLSIPIITTVNWGQSFAISKLWDKSKATALLLAGLIIVAKSIVIAHNLHTMRQ